MKEEKIKILVKEVGKKPEEREVRNELRPLQKIVGGYVEAVTVCSNLAIMCNEDGKIIGLPYNCRIFGEDFVGTIAFIGFTEDDFASVDVNTVKRLFPKMWEA